MLWAIFFIRIPLAALLIYIICNIYIIYMFSVSVVFIEESMCGRLPLKNQLVSDAVLVVCVCVSDEVREMGRTLGLPEDRVMRHPFPGPGLAVRIVGCVDSQRVKILQEADAIFLQEIKKAGLYDQIAQARNNTHTHTPVPAQGYIIHSDARGLGFKIVSRV